MIWNYIRDFIVQYIFGGYTSNGEYFGGAFGNTLYENGGYYEVGDAPMFEVGNILNDDGAITPLYYEARDWLSTTFTIIIMCLIVVFAIWLVRWVFKAVSSAFLLK